MGKARLLILFWALIFSHAISADTATDMREEALLLAESYVGLLKPKLQAAMMEGGPTHAVEVCASVAPGIAISLSERSGWQVKRVSLRQRNSRAEPDDFEAGILKQFDQRQNAGEAARTLVHFEDVDGTFRFLKAQPVEPVCLACHGEAIHESVKEKLADYYPDDQALGYSLGQVRGAISLKKVRLSE